MTIFFTADTHFGHEKAINYHSNDKKIRPWNSVNDQDRELIDNWNSVISKDDTVYHVGDVCDTSVVGIGDCVDRLNGIKILVKGNLDIADNSEYLKQFDEVYDEFHTIELDGYRILLSHNYTSIENISKYNCSLNIHGHLHADCVQDPRYFCVSLERTNFHPISTEQLLLSIKENQLKYVKNIKF
jgi:calcineurin-like phosphoesterase family protein